MLDVGAERRLKKKDELVEYKHELKLRIEQNNLGK
jgi:hypothetical protein